jgi:DNA-binding PadR family transcriptional regulator
MAQYYLAPLGEVLRGMLPLMAEVRRTVYYRITDLGRDVLAKSVEGESIDFPSQNRIPLRGRPGLKSCPDTIPARSRVRDRRTWGTRISRRRKRKGETFAEEQDLERRVLARLARASR